MKRPSMTVIFLASSIGVLTIAGYFSAPAIGAVSNSSIITPLTMLAPTNLRQPLNPADCLKHVANGGQGYFEHVAYGCSHPTPNYTIVIWDWSGRADGFHVYRVDGQRTDYGTHNDGTIAYVYQTGYACFVVTAIRGTNESADSNRLCILPTSIRFHRALPTPTPTPLHTLPPWQIRAPVTMPTLTPTPSPTPTATPYMH